MHTIVKSFGSDNQSGVHPRVLEALAAANVGHQPAYGADAVTAACTELFKQVFDCDLELLLVFTGTAANTLAIRSCCASYEAVIATQIAHIHEDECGATEFLSGNKILTYPHHEGKLMPAVLKDLHLRVGDPHRVAPRLVSITQATELGTVYTVEEIRTLANLAHQRGLLLHMDGARLVNAAVFLGCSLAELTVEAGVDILSFGGTKNGLLCGEALVFFRRDLSLASQYYRKQAAQLASKMRFLACQYIPYLGDELWRHNALQANAMAQYLRQRLAGLNGVQFPYPTEANEVFVKLPESLAQAMQERSGAYAWGPGLLRFVSSFDTTPEDIDALFD